MSRITHIFQYKKPSLQEVVIPQLVSCKLADMVMLLYSINGGAHFEYQPGYWLSQQDFHGFLRSVKTNVCMYLNQAMSTFSKSFTSHHFTKHPITVAVQSEIQKASPLFNNNFLQGRCTVYILSLYTLIKLFAYFLSFLIIKLLVQQNIQYKIQDKIQYCLGVVY